MKNVVRFIQYEWDMLEWAQANDPVAICLATVAPGGQAKLRSQCQRFRRRFPKLKIIVGYWGYREDAETLRAKFKRSGADQVVFSLKECRNELTPFLRTASQRQVLAQNEEEELVAEL